MDTPILALSNPRTSSTDLVGAKAAKLAVAAAAGLPTLRGFVLITQWMPSHLQVLHDGWCELRHSGADSTTLADASVVNELQRRANDAPTED